MMQTKEEEEIVLSRGSCQNVEMMSIHVTAFD